MMDTNFRQLFQGSPSAMFVYEDATSQILAANPAAERLYGYGPTEFLALQVRDLLPGMTSTLGSPTAPGGKAAHRNKTGAELLGETISYPLTWDMRAAHCVQVTAITQCVASSEHRLFPEMRPPESGEGIRFEDLFDISDIQRLQDQFASATGVASIITRPDGTPITRPSNFTSLCADIIRKTEKGRVHCHRSDAALGRVHSGGAIVQPCLSGGLWDAGTSIVVNGRHIANWLIGQVRDESQDENQMRAYAREIGADEAAFIAAFRQVPAMSLKRFRDIAEMLCTLSQQLSALAFHNVQQARFIAERKAAEEALRASEAQFRATIEHSGAGYFRLGRAGLFETVNSAWLEMHGMVSPDQINGRHFSTTQIDSAQDEARRIVQEGFAGSEFQSGEFTRKRADGTVGYHTFSLHPVRHDDEVIALEGFLIDTTSLHRVMADYKMLFDTMLDGFALHEIICDAAGSPVDYRFIAVNRAFEWHTGLKVSDLVGRTVLEVLPGTEPSWIQRYGRVALTGEPVTFHAFSEALNRHFEVSAFRAAPGRFGCIVVDVTARRFADLQVRKLSRAVEQSPVSVIIMDVQGAIEYVNPYFTAKTGYTLDDVRGQTQRLLDSGETPGEIYTDLWQTIASGREWRGEFHNRKKDGTLYWEAATIGPILDEDGRITHFLAVKEDITERKRSDEALRESEVHFRQLYDQSPVGYQSLDVDGRLLDVNAAWLKLLGYERHEVIGRWFGDFLVPEQIEVFRSRFPRFKAAGAIEGVEFDFRRKDGTIVSTSVDGRVAHNADGGYRQTHCVLHDVTARKQTQAILAASERRFRSLVENVPNIAVQSYDRNRRVVFWNGASEALYGYTAEEALGRQLEDLIIPPEMRKQVIAAVDGMVERNEQIPAGELVLRRKDGSPVSVFSSHVKLERTDGEPEMHCIDIDLTARKEAERALAESHDFHLRMLSEAPALIWRSGTDGKCNWFNTTWLAFTGRAMAQEIGDGWTEGVHPDDLAHCFGTYKAAFATRAPFEMVYRIRRRDGEYRWISDQGIPFTSMAGQFAGYIGYCFDITERRHAEERLRQQAELLDVARDAILVTDLQGVVSYWNHAAEILYEIPRTQALGQPFERLVYKTPPPEFRGQWAALLATGEGTVEEQHETKGGRTIEVRTRATLTRNAEGNPLSVLLLISDITESRRLEAQLLRVQRLESLGALASGVAHDLNNVLTPILLSVDLLRPLATTKHDQDMLQLLNDSARRGSDIVRQLLLFGRGGDSRRAPLNGCIVIREVGRMVSETFPKNISFAVQAPSDLRLVQADRTQIHQVILNLCVNARDAMPQGGRLTITAENTEVGRAFATAHGTTRYGAYVRIEVKDTGMGMSREVLDKIFDPFFTTKPVGQGTGLGLATVLGIVRSHGGFVDVRSEPGRGSTFCVYLPATSGVETNAGSDEADVGRGRGEVVLIVDDEENIRRMLQRALHRANYEVLTAANGAEAISVFSQSVDRVRLVLTDMMMPVMDGVLTVRALRRLDPDLAVVAISGLPEQRIEMDKTPGSRVRFLPKPFTTDDALREVRRALDAAASPSPGAST